MEKLSSPGSILRRTVLHLVYPTMVLWRNLTQSIVFNMSSKFSFICSSEMLIIWWLDKPQFRNWKVEQCRYRRLVNSSALRIVIKFQAKVIFLWTLYLVIYFAPKRPNRILQYYLQDIAVLMFKVNKNLLRPYVQDLFSFTREQRQLSIS